jgi:formylglycine-generating enzyme required for sulfatase activity
MTRCFCLSLVVCVASHAAAHAQPKETPKSYTNNVGMKFVLIKSGTFSMGSPETEKDRNVIEVEHTVKLTKAFYLGVYPVTQEQWHAVVSQGYDAPAEGFDLGNPSRFEGERHLPVETVSWNDCQVFIKKLRARDKRNYRLPTEAEWEYACRAGSTTPYYSGETSATLLANFAGAAVKGSKKGIGKKTSPVGSFPPNAWGLCDMEGNVSQWCQDRYGPYAAKGAIDPQGSDKGGTRVLRGGSWEDGAGRCRSAYRGWDSQDNRGTGTWGLRVCIALD